MFIIHSSYVLQSHINTEWVNMELLLQEERALGSLCISGHILVNQSTHNLILYAFLFKMPSLIHIVSLLTLNSRLRVLELKPEWSFSNREASLYKAHHSLPMLRNGEHQFTIMPGAYVEE